MNVVLFSTVFIGLLCYVTSGTCRNKKRQNMKQTQLQWNKFSSYEKERSQNSIRNPAEKPPTSNDDVFGRIGNRLLQKKIQDPPFSSYNRDTEIGSIPNNVGRLRIDGNNGDRFELIDLQGGKKRLVNKLVGPNKGLKGDNRSLISQTGVPKGERLWVLQGDNRGLSGRLGNVGGLQNGIRPSKWRLSGYNGDQRNFGVLQEDIKRLNISLGYKKGDLVGSGILGSGVEIIGVDNSTSEKDGTINKFNKDGIRIFGDDTSRMEGESDGPWILGDNTDNMRDTGGVRLLGDNTYTIRDNGGLRTLGDNNLDSKRDYGGLRIIGDNTSRMGGDNGGLRILGDDTSKMRGYNGESNTPVDNTNGMNDNGGLNTLRGDTIILGGDNGGLKTLGDNPNSMRYNGKPGKLNDDASIMNSQSDGFRPVDYYSTYNRGVGNNGSNMNYDYMSNEEGDDNVLSLLVYGKNPKERNNNRR